MRGVLIRKGEKNINPKIILINTMTIVLVPLLTNLAIAIIELNAADHSKTQIMLRRLFEILKVLAFQNDFFKYELLFFNYQAVL
jgi:hypothetical protein